MQNHLSCRFSRQVIMVWRAYAVHLQMALTRLVAGVTHRLERSPDLALELVAEPHHFQSDFRVDRRLVRCWCRARVIVKDGLLFLLVESVIAYVLGPDGHGWDYDPVLRIFSALPAGTE